MKGGVCKWTMNLVMMKLMMSAMTKISNKIKN